MSHKKCEVKGCIFNSGKKFHFPKCTERCTKWISASGNIDLLQLTSEKLIERVLCDAHFEDRFKLCKGLSKTAIPTLNLPHTIEASHCNEIVQNDIDLPNVSSAHHVRKSSDDIDSSESDATKIAQTKVVEQIDKASIEYATTSTVDLVQAEHSISFDIQKRTSPVKNTIAAKKKKGSLLHLFHVTRTSNLSLRDKHLYNKIISVMKMARNQKRKQISLQQRLQKMKELAAISFNTAIAEMPKVMQNFFLSNIKNLKRRKYKRQYTMEDKAFALSLARRGPRLYRFLTNIFCLPSTETLRKLIHNIPINCGISDCVFENLRQKVEKFTDYREKYCILLFDEMKVSPGLYYNKSSDTIEGVVDTGINRIPQFADHAQVWMIKGIYGQRPWKQPVSYSFCKGTSSWENICYMYKEIAKRCRNAGLIIIASICDQGSTNVKAIKTMIFDTKRQVQTEAEKTDDIIIIEDMKIIPLFDPPHLLKCIRNNLLTKDCKYILENESRVAKWSDIIQTYIIDKSRGCDGFLEKIKDYHVIPEKIKKMKVRYCTQVFSNTYAKVMLLYSKQEMESKCKTCKISRDAINTASFLKFFNTLFDSINGGINMKDRNIDNKTMTFTTTDDSTYDNIWNSAIIFLQNMQFQKKKAHDKSKPEVLNNFVHTLRGFKLLRKYLQEIGFLSFATREFNQDPLENFFGQMRQHGGRNNNPTCTNFGYYYRSLMLNSCTQNALRGSNCEQADMQNLIDMLTIPAFNTDIQEANDKYIIPDENIQELFNNTVIENIINNIIDKILSTVRGCETCCAILSNEKESVAEYIKKITALTDYFINNYFYITGILKNIKNNMKKYNLSCIDCEHKHIQNYILNTYIPRCITRNIKTINNILKGFRIPLTQTSKLHDLAYAYYDTHKSFNK